MARMESGNQKASWPRQSFLYPLKDRIASAYREVAPERQELIGELSKLIDEVNIEDRLDSFAAVPAWQIVTGSWWALEALWCCAYAIAVYGPLVEQAVQDKQRVLDLKGTSDALVATGVLNWALEVLQAGNRCAWLHANVSWPYTHEGLPPFEDGALAAAEKIFFGATGWILLHELAHIDRGHQNAIDPIQAEREADSDATAWLLEKAPFGEPHDRASGLICALLYMWMREFLSGNSDSDHPPVKERIASCLSEEIIQRNAWVLCTLAAMGEIFYQGMGVDTPGLNGETFDTCREYLDNITSLTSARPASA
jgi:hypothetical protein